MNRSEKIRQYILENRQQIMDDTLVLVNCQSPTDRKDYAESCADAIEKLARERLGIVPAQVFPQENNGRHLYFRVGQGRKKALLIGHYDTVWDIDRLPVLIDGNRFAGPGSFDMKYGIAASFWAIKALQETGGFDGELGLFFNSDEEIGSPTSRDCFAPIARQYENALIMEGSEDGNLTVGRQAVGVFQIKVHGIAAHAGMEYAKGRSAILEAARLTEELFAMTDLSKGSTVNVGVLNGGTKRNVFAAYAELLVDVRAACASEGERLCAAIENLKPHQDGITLEISGGITRPPFETTDAILALLAKAKTAAHELGHDFDGVVSCGGSDGNITAGLGIPTLDSLGPVGEGAHAENEHFLIEESLRYTAILANFLTKL